MDNINSFGYIKHISNLTLRDDIFWISLFKKQSLHKQRKVK